MPHGAFIFGCSGTALSSHEAGFFRHADPWGFILFARNVEGPAQLTRLTAALRESVGRDAPILIDQEGGRVQRMGPPHWRDWLPPLDQMSSVEPGQAARAMYLRYRLIAAELRAVGIDVNCAPTADVAGETTHPFVRNRCYGDTPATVIGASRAVAQGLLAGGVLPVLKHIPGHGRATVDSHLNLPRVSAPRAALIAEDFAPFRGLADLPLGMTAHIVYDAIDPDRPATQSPQAVAAIRTEIGFDGLLMTDDLGMQALAGSMGARAAAAIDAGCDVALHCSGDAREMEEVAVSAGRLSDAAARRADRALAQRRAPDAADPEALAEEFEALVHVRVGGDG